MGDRVRIGELLAAIGVISLAVSLGVLKWFQPHFVANRVAYEPQMAHFPHPPTSNAGPLGWFAFAVLFLAVIAGLVFILRVLTGRGPERAMLQAPVAYVVSGFAFLVLIVRVFAFRPTINPDSISGKTLFTSDQLSQFHVHLSLLPGAYVGIVGVWLVCVGSWFAMYDERTGSAAAKKRTAELLAAAPIREVPHVPAPAEADADVIADDAVATDPEAPFPSAPGEPA